MCSDPTPYSPRKEQSKFACVAVCVVVCVAVCCSAGCSTCCSVLQCVLQCVAVCCSVLQCVAACCNALRSDTLFVGKSKVNARVLLCALQHGLQCVLQCGAVCCSVLQCVTVCCSVLRSNTLFASERARFTRAFASSHLDISSSSFSRSAWSSGSRRAIYSRETCSSDVAASRSAANSSGLPIYSVLECVGECWRWSVMECVAV